jgi:hypothetical protein
VIINFIKEVSHGNSYGFLIGLTTVLFLVICEFLKRKTGWKLFSGSSVFAILFGLVLNNIFRWDLSCNI